MDERNEYHFQFTSTSWDIVHQTPARRRRIWNRKPKAGSVLLAVLLCFVLAAGGTIFAVALQDAHQKSSIGPCRVETAGVNEVKHWYLRSQTKQFVVRTENCGRFEISASALMGMSNHRASKLLETLWGGRVFTFELRGDPAKHQPKIIGARHMSHEETSRYLEHGKLPKLSVQAPSS